MFWAIMFVIGLAVLAGLLLMLSLCKVAADADQRAEEMHTEREWEVQP